MAEVIFEEEGGGSGLARLVALERAPGGRSTAVFCVGPKKLSSSFRFEGYLP
jgi:hypothetical protein